MLRVFNNLTASLPARMATPLRWLMVAGIAYTLANSLMYLLAGPESVSGPAPAAGQVTRPASAAIDIEPLLARNLFGAAGARPASMQTTEAVAVATQLPLELRGVFVAEGAGVSAAIIAERGRPGLLYAAGQDVAGSATLESVHADHVILRRAGVAETLHFPRPGQGLAPQAPMDEPAMPADAPYEETPVDVDAYEEFGEPPFEDSSAEPADANAADPVSAYRDRLESDPEGALQSLGMSPVSAASASGYRVDSLAQAPYLSQTGLQPGDVILSVNGRPVGDLSRDRLEIENVLAQGSARIEVQRGTRRFFVTAALP